LHSLAINLPPGLNGDALSVCFLLFSFQGFTFVNDLFHRTPSAQLIGGLPPQSYGALPPNNGIRPLGSTSAGHTARYAAPGPTDAFPELLPPLSPVIPSQPFVPPLPIRPTVVPTRKRKSKGIGGLILFIIAVFLLSLVIVCRSNTLARFIGLEYEIFNASREESALKTGRIKSERERGKMRLERELWEGKKGGKDRVPQGAHWKHIWPAYNCLAYGKREYWGILVDIPGGWDAVDACMNTPAEVKGVTVRRPRRCAFVDGFPHIHGYWVVDWDQEDCKPHHKDLRDVVSPTPPHRLVVILPLIYAAGMYKPSIRPYSNRGKS
jgi:hypothetical protein